MRKQTFFQWLLLLCVITAGATKVWGETSTITFSSTGKTGSSAKTSDGVTWAISSDATEQNGDSSKGIHYGSNNAEVTYIQLSTSDIKGTVTKVVVNATNAGSNGKVLVTVGGATFGTEATISGTSNAEYTFEGNATGEIVVKVYKTTKAKKALYVKSVAVTYIAKADVETFKFNDLTPSVSLEDGEAEYTQEVTTVNDYDGTITYTLSENTCDAINEGAYILAGSTGSVKVTAKGTGSSKYKDTEEISYVLTVNPEAGKLGDIVFSPAAGEVVKGTKVSISAYEAENIYYSVDGSDPTTLYSVPIAITEALTLKAKAVKGSQEKTAEAIYTLTIPTEEVVIWEEDWSTGTINGAPSTANKDNATYTPTNSNGTYIIGQNPIAGSETPEMLIKSGSPLTCVISLGGITGEMTLTYKTNKTTLAVSTTTEGATAERVGNAVVGTNSFKFSNVTGETLTIVFTASENTRLDDIVLTGTRVATEPSAPQFYIAGSEVTDSYEITSEEGIQLTIAEANGAAIYYTTDGTEPSTLSTKYTAPITVTDALTVKALAQNVAGTSGVATLTITKHVIPTPVITLSAENIEMEVGETGKVLTATATLSGEAFEGAITFFTSDAALTIDAEGNITCTTAGTYTITAAIAANADNWNAAEAVCTVTATPKTDKFILVNEIENGGQFLLVATKTADNSLHAATKTLNGSYLEQATVTATDNIIKQSADNAFTITVDGDAYTLQIDGKYLKSTAAKTVTLESSADDATSWSLYKKSDAGYMFTTPSGSKTLYFSYNSSSPRYTTYDSDGQQPYNFYQLLPSTVTVSVTAAAKGLATYYSQFALDFTDVTDIYAYTAEVSGTTVTFTRQKGIVPAGTGLLLRNPEGVAAEADVPVTTAAAAAVSNAFTGTLNGLAALATTADDGSVNYILSTGSQGIGFYRAAGQSVGAHKAYLCVPAGARTFIAFSEGETTGISDASRLVNSDGVNSDGADCVVYNLQGQRLENAQLKGLKSHIVIVNGKKVIIK